MKSSIDDFLQQASTQLDKEYALKKGDFVTVILKHGQGLVEGVFRAQNNHFVIVEKFISGAGPEGEDTVLKNYASENAGYVPDFTIYKHKDILSITKHIKYGAKETENRD